MEKLLTPVTIWYSVSNGGDGSAYPHFFLTEEETEYDQDHMYEGWGETCNGSIETFVGSKTYLEAVTNSQKQQKKRKKH